MIPVVRGPSEPIAMRSIRTLACLIPAALALAGCVHVSERGPDGLSENHEWMHEADYREGRAQRSVWVGFGLGPDDSQR
jgi:hypothetical protein